jgi:hypothetical protein
MQLIDLMDPPSFGDSRLAEPSRCSRGRIITGSTVQLGFALAWGSPQPHAPPHLCGWFYRLIRPPDCTGRFGRCHAARDHDGVPAPFTDLLVPDESLEARGVLLSSCEIQNMDKPGSWHAFGDSYVGLIGWIVVYGVEGMHP